MLRCFTRMVMILGLFALSLQAWSQQQQEPLPDLNKPITVDQALQIAFCKSPSIRISVDQIQRSSAVVAEAKANFNPRFNAAVNYQLQGPKSKVTIQGVGTVDLVTSSNTIVQGSVFLPLDINNAIGYATDIAKYGYQINYLDLSRVSRQLIFDVRTAYYDLLRRQAQEQVAQATVDSDAAQLKDTRARFEAGAVPMFDVTRAEVQVSNDNQSLIAARSRTAIARSNLNRLMGVDVNTNTVVVEPDITVDKNAKLDIPQQIETAYELRPEILQQELVIQANQKNVKLQRADYLPNLGINGAINYTVKTSGLNASNQSWITTFGLNIPIWNGGITRARVNQAKADVLISEDTLDQLKFNVAQEVRAAALNLQQAAESVSTTQQGVTLAEEALRLARVRYEAGIATLVEVTDAQSALTRARVNLVDARFDYATALADLQRATATQPELEKLQLLCPPMSQS